MTIKKLIKEVIQGEVDKSNGLRRIYVYPNGYTFDLSKCEDNPQFNKLDLNEKPMGLRTGLKTITCPKPNQEFPLIKTISKLPGYAVPLKDCRQCEFHYAKNRKFYCKFVVDSDVEDNDEN